MIDEGFDFIIIGSGIAGLYTALLAREVGNVLILTKGSIDECNTKYAQGGIAAPIGRDDSPEIHFEDTIAAGAGLCDPEAVRILVNEASDRIADLIEIGVPFDTQDGEVALAREAAHSRSRILHAGGDATGKQIEVTLSKAARVAPNITIMEHCLATEIIVRDGIAQGVIAFDSRAGSIEEFHAPIIILTTGGAGRLFKLTTNPDIATGDGVALAYRAGAEITDMEFFQFHPTALRLPGVPPFLISEAVRGEGGVLRNVEGHRFMHHYTPEADLARRDIVARSIVAEMRKTGSDRVFLDVTHLPRQTITTRFPHIYRFCLKHGLDITRGLIPVAPAAHYMMGGVKTNTRGETNISGLFACGEVACTGVHGANRLASNSLMEVLVFSKRIIETFGGKETVRDKKAVEERHFTLRKYDTSRITTPLRLAILQSLMWDNAGIIRSRDKLEEAALVLAAWYERLQKPTDRPYYELCNMVLVGRLLIEAALIREESRGAHFRSDFPEPSSGWEKHIIFRNTP
ncbi:MAG: L-aspartate oxidase [Dehalococcoidia bacterium]|nr:L-aspartate oxidase [Chloroflexota bacterium]MBT9162501.1 L-aspartate oxidase [Chloroflexota bacterium]